MHSKLNRLSFKLASIERKISILLLGSMFIVMLVNVLSRTIGTPIYGGDELAISLMVWMVFLGASLLIHERGHLTVSLLSEAFYGRAKPLYQALRDLMIFCICGLFFAMSWLWFNPIELILQKGNIENFTHTTFNYIYVEPTNTLGINKWILWVIVPLSSVSMCLHAGANLWDSLCSFTQKAQSIEEHIK